MRERRKCKHCDNLCHVGKVTCWQCTKIARVANPPRQAKPQTVRYMEIWEFEELQEANGVIEYEDYDPGKRKNRWK